MKLLFILLSASSFLLDHGASFAYSAAVSVMEGDSVTLRTCVNKTQQDTILWYYNDTRIAQINRDQSKICTDVQCNEGTERFRDRLKLDHQTGSLTIINTRNTDSGVYQLKISSGSSDSENTFNVSVTGVSAAGRYEVKRKEGESVTLDSDVKRNPNDVMTYYFNDIHIAEITGGQIKTYEDVQCNERFRDRLKLDQQTGSLNITHTRTEDSGVYKVQRNSSNSRNRRSISNNNNIEIFEVTVTGSGPSSSVPGSGPSSSDPGSGLSSGAVAGIVVGVLLVFAAAAVAAVIYYQHRSSKKGYRQKDISNNDIIVEEQVREMEKDRGHVF